MTLKTDQILVFIPAVAAVKEKYNWNKVAKAKLNFINNGRQPK